jgi:drug/metabolite transporter (DMT)-like permease
MIKSTINKLKGSYNQGQIKRKKSKRASAIFAVGVVSILWGTTWMASKIGVKHMPALQLSGLRHLIGGGMYVIYFLLFKKMFPKKHQLIQILWMSILMFVLSNGLSVLSVVYMPSGLGAVVGAIAPIWVVLFSVFIFKRIKIKPQTVIGIFIGFFGVVITFYEFLGDILHSNFSLGIIFGVISSITWALGTLFTSKQTKDMDPYFALGWQMFISGLILNAISFSSGNFVSYAEIPLEGWYSIAYLVLIGSVIAFGAYIFALKRLPATLVSIHSYINPIVAILIGSLIMNEELTLFIFTGTIITLIGVYIVKDSFKRKIKIARGENLA